ncbi:MAG: PH domain-containing protein [Ruminococcus sp.]|nr:PH domain-containing protein [Ruminococcus sp.]
MYHEHPLKVLKYSMKNIWLLIFPLIRGFTVLHFNAYDLYVWIKGAWFDLAVIGAILIFGFVKWHFSTIDIDENAIVHKEGIIIKIKTSIPINNISVATAEYPMYLMPFNGVRLSCDTRSGFFKNSDMKLLITKKVCDEIMKYMPDVNTENLNKEIEKPDMLSVILFSFLFSSGFSGVVYVATFFVKGGSIAHDIISASLARITETTEMINSKLLIGIPTAAVAVGVIFISAWLLSFAMNLLRYSMFHIESDNSCISVTCGLTNRRVYRIKCPHINYIDLRQNLIMKIAGAVTVNVSCAGFGSDSQYLPVIFPIKLEKNISGLEKMGISDRLMPDFRPRLSSWWTYICQPLILTAVIFPLRYLSDRFFPQFAELSFFTAVMLEIPCVWLIAVKTAALLTSGVSVYDGKIVFRCSKINKFHTVIAERNHMIKFEIHQNIFQKISRKCDIIFWFCGETHSRFRIKAIYVGDAKKLAEIMEYSLESKSSRLI